MSKGPGNPYHDPKTGEFSSGPGQSARVKQVKHSGTGQKADRNAPFKDLKYGEPVATGRFSQLNNTQKARLTASARVVSEFTKEGKFRRNVPKKIQTPFEPSVEHHHAVTIQTARALDQDFHRDREKRQQAEMHAAIARHLAKKKGS